MKLDKVANSKNDEFYTPRYAVKPIIKYLTENGFDRVWCPFDTMDSNFVKMLTDSGFDVVATHIDNGEDFFDYVAPECDVIVSNPPYSVKGDVLEVLFGQPTPFAMLVGVVGLFESQKRFEMFRDNDDFEIMYFNRRVSYFKDYADQKPSLNPPFSSVYIARDVLPQTIMFETIDKKDI